MGDYDSPATRLITPTKFLRLNLLNWHISQKSIIVHLYILDDGITHDRKEPAAVPAADVIPMIAVSIAVYKLENTKQHQRFHSKPMTSSLIEAPVCSFYLTHYPAQLARKWCVANINSYSVTNFSRTPYRQKYRTTLVSANCNKRTQSTS